MSARAVRSPSPASLCRLSCLVSPKISLSASSSTLKCFILLLFGSLAGLISFTVEMPFAMQEYAKNVASVFYHFCCACFPGAGRKHDEPDAAATNDAADDATASA